LKNSQVYEENMNIHIGYFVLTVRITVGTIFYRNMLRLLALLVTVILDYMLSQA